MDLSPQQNTPVTIGFAWRRIATISQHLLANDVIGAVSFDEWCQHFINQYDEKCAQYEKLLTEQVETLRSVGVSHVFIVPEALGTTKLDVFNRLMRELPSGSFLLVTSWNDFGPPSIVIPFVEKAAKQQIYVILPSHTSLRLLPMPAVPMAHQDWVIDQIAQSYSNPRSRRDQILALQEQGMSADQIQLDLGISKSAYYRHIDAAAPMVERSKLMKELLTQNKTQAEIQAILKISNSTYYRILAQMRRIESIVDSDD